MTPKERLLQELDGVNEPLIVETLDFLQFLKAKQARDEADVGEAREVLATVEAEGTVSWEALKSEVGL